MNDLPLVVAYGMGVDSTAVLVQFERLGIRPDRIVFADTGSEADHTYDFHPVMNEWLRSVDFPEIEVVRYQATDFKHWPPYHSLEENCLTNSTLPSLAYGGKSCSQKWKIAPQNKLMDQWEPAQIAWDLGMKVRKVVGYDAGPNDIRRRNHVARMGTKDAEKYDFWYPLQDWGWDRERCIDEIAKSSLPYVPKKSSCYFCPAMKPHELHSLSKDKLRRIVMIEARPHQRHIDHADAKRDELRKMRSYVERHSPTQWPQSIQKTLKSLFEKLKEKEERAPNRKELLKAIDKKLKSMGQDGTPLIEGLWRKPVKGFRGATPKPGSMTEYIRSSGLLPSEEIAYIQAQIPSTPITKDDIDNWQDWIGSVTTCSSCAGCTC